MKKIENLDFTNEHPLFFSQNVNCGPENALLDKRTKDVEHTKTM